MTVNTSAIQEEIQLGLVPAEIYADPEIFSYERERIFGRSWCFLAHESEIAAPGDYVVRRIIDDSFIVVRAEDGAVNVLLNMCLHRGMQLCRAERGNSSHFRCPYHAWTYKNSGELVGMPFHKEAYGGEDILPRRGKRLVSAPQVGIVDGMIFACLDPSPDAPSLEEFLGDYRFYLDIYMKQSESGAEVRGPQRWRVPSNWKIGSENFAGDSYHTAYTHASIIDIELFGPSKRMRRKLNAVWTAGSGSGTTHRFSDGSGDFRSKLMEIGYPEEMIERMRGAWSPQQVALIEDAGFMPSASAGFPNLAFIHTFVRIAENGPDVPFTSMRVWQPVSATETEILSWFVVDREAPEWFKEQSYRAYVMCFGPSGMFEQDDVENWAAITRASGSQMARTLKLNSRMGLDADGSIRAPRVEDWPAPGEAHLGFGEVGQRQFLRRWAALLADDTKDAVTGRATIGDPRTAASVQAPSPQPAA